MTDTATPPLTPRPAGPRPKRAPSPVLERLFALYPRMFGARFLPLKLGVYQELLALHPDDFKKEELKLALGQHARSTRYLEAVASGAPRHDLNAQPVEPVAPEHVHHAILEVYRRRLSRDKVAATQWLRARLVAAIEASGLARDAYLERMPTPDPVAAAVLDEAFAELAERAAKREALRRAFAASGKTAEEFADMYGMDLAVVKQAVAT
ncbi:MAG: ProQ/FINO family protein [Ramlibacter sp.]|jgi:sRNA-binding protein